MIKYQRNNILFRIASATAIAKFKNDQASAFAQLIRKELYFDNSAKESVLIEYDRFSQWIYRIERVCLSHGDQFLPQPLASAVINSCLDELFIIEKIIETNPVVFKPEVLEYAKLIHMYARPILRERLENAAKDCRTDVAFGSMLSEVSVYLQHVLLAFYELNNNLYAKTKPKFACVTDFCTTNTLKDEHDLLPTLSRINFFESKELSNISASQFEIKNYTSVFDDSKLESILTSNGKTICMEQRKEGE